MKPNAGSAVDAAFKLTSEERAKIARACHDYKHSNLTLDICINRIEAIINEGWQTCD